MLYRTDLNSLDSSMKVWHMSESTHFFPIRTRLGSDTDPVIPPSGSEVERCRDFSRKSASASGSVLVPCAPAYQGSGALNIGVDVIHRRIMIVVLSVHKKERRSDTPQSSATMHSKLVSGKDQDCIVLLDRPKAEWSISRVVQPNTVLLLDRDMGSSSVAASINSGDWHNLGQFNF
jgi:hypothetical protein